MSEKRPSFLSYLQQRLSGSITVASLDRTCYAHKETPVVCKINDSDFYGYGATGYEAYCAAVIGLNDPALFNQKGFSLDQESNPNAS